MKKKALSLILVAALVCAMLPTAALAAADSDFTIENGILSKYNGPGGDVVIPDGVTSIRWDTFKGRKDLTSVVMPDSVISIGPEAFYGCTGLTSVTIPNSVTIIGDDAFRGCTSLTSIIIPDSVTSIGWSAFEGCTSLTSVTLPKKIDSFGEAVFANTPWLASRGEFAVIYGVLTKYQGDGGQVTIPDGVTRIADGAFYRCTSLIGITIPDSVTGIGQSAFSGCTNLTSVTIPDSVNGIGQRAFDDCTSLTSITISDGITCIGWGTFSGCSGLTSVTLGNGVTEIRQEAFSGCTSLTGITFPSSVTKIESNAFKGCAKLTSVTALGSPTDIDRSAFSETPWAKDRGDFVTINGHLISYEGSGGDVVISDSVTSIGAEAFQNCRALTSVTIPDSVTSIGDEAFQNCKKLTSVTLPRSAADFGWRTFQDCQALTSVTIPDGVTVIEYATFSNCFSLTSVTIPNSVTHIEDSAFGDCNRLADVYYDGNEAQWTAIDISGSGNGCLTGAVIHVNDTATEVPKSVPADGIAYPSTQKVDVDGQAIEFQCYALKDEKGNDTNYIKLRDLADILNGSAAQFEVGWNGNVTITTGTAYTPNGSEHKTPFSGQREYRIAAAQTLVNGEAKDLAAFTLTDDNGGGYTYYKLRDLGEALGFKVDWTRERGIFIETK